MKQKTGIICHTIIKNKGKILLVRRNSKDVDDPNLWEFPGGALEFGEHPEETAKREAKEETGIEIGNLKLQYLMSYTYEKPDKKIHLLRFFYVCETDNNEIKLDPNEHKDYVWSNKDELINFSFQGYLEEAWGELIDNDKV